MDVSMEEQAALAQAEYAEVFGGGPKEKAKDKDKEQADQWPDQERKPKYSRGEGKAGKGGSWNAASSWDPKGSWGQQKKWGDQSQNDNSLDAQTQHLIQAMVRLSLRHEQELGMIRAETGFMLFLDTPMHHPMSFLPKLQEIAADWTEKNAAGLVKTGLKVTLMMALVKELQTRLEAFRDDPEKITRAEATGWISQGIHRDGSGLALFRLESQDETAGTLGATPGVYQRSPDLPGHSVQEPGGTGCTTEVQEHQRLGGQLRLGGGGPISSMDRAPEQSSPSVLPSLHAACRQCSDETAGPSNPSGAACQTASSKEGGGMLQGSELLRLEQSQLNELPSRRSCLGRQQGAAGSEGAQQPSPYAPRLPIAKLINQANYCYLHSCLQAVYWTGEIMGCPPGCYGKLQAGFALLRNPRKITIPECLSLRPVLRGWQDPLQQHDAGEYMSHLLCTLQSPSYLGHWEARLTNPHTVTDRGQLSTPVLLHPEGGSLADLLGRWHQQYAVHALHQHAGALIARIVRYSYAAVAAKNCRPIRVLPGEVVAVPIFAEADGTIVRYEAFRVVVVIFHIGERVDSGHYQAALAVPDRTAVDCWKYWVCDDGRSPRVATRKEQGLIECNSYLIGLVRSN